MDLDILAVREEAKTREKGVDFDSRWEEMLEGYEQARTNQMEDYMQEYRVQMESTLTQMLDMGFTKECIGFYQSVYKCVIGEK